MTKTKTERFTNEEVTIEKLKKSAASHATNSIKAYAHDWKLFERWCADNGRVPLPATTGDVADYVTDALNCGHKVSTVTRRVASILYQHREKKVTPFDAAEIRGLLKGARRLRREQPTRKHAISIEDIRAMRNKRSGRELTQVRDWAIMLVGFATALRRCNLSGLNLDDVQASERGLIIRVHWEKQDQAGVGRHIGVPYGKHPETCPVRAMHRWLEFRGKEPGPLFVTVQHGRVKLDRLHPGRISIIVKKGMQQLGYDPINIGAHSLRAGFVTEAVDAGVEEIRIAKQTGHRSLATLRMYYRQRDPFRGNACASLDL